MEIEEEVVVPQPEEQQAPTEAEIADWKQKASVSSQNFERAKKAEAEKADLQKKLEEAQLAQDSFVSDDDTAKKLRELDEKFSKLEEEKRIESIKASYPAIADKMDEFNEYRSAYPSDKLDSVAKLFMVERDLLGDAPKRKGLEKAVGGKRTPPNENQTTDDVKRLRETNYREYVKQIKAGKIQV